MNTKIVLVSSAVFLGVCGIATIFAPHEILRGAGVGSAGVLPVAVQLLGALLFAFAMVNWTARGSLIGGIYNRPVALGNLTHFTIGALGLAKAVLSGEHATPLVILACLYVLFAIAFAMVFFQSPVSGRGGE